MFADIRKLSRSSHLRKVFIAPKIAARILFISDGIDANVFQSINERMQSSERSHFIKVTVQNVMNLMRPVRQVGIQRILRLKQRLS